MLNNGQIVKVDYSMTNTCLEAAHLCLMFQYLFDPFTSITEEDGKPASIKLTDYVVTASLFPQQFYIAEDGTVSELVRWMAPESITDFTFTSKSDVVSFYFL